jgi:hypothetical protein
MYLFVFIFLLLATMGLFTQTYMIQAARLWANQKTAAELRFVWHRGAMSWRRRCGKYHAGLQYLSL